MLTGKMIDVNIPEMWITQKQFNDPMTYLTQSLYYMWISCVYNTLNVDKYGVEGAGGPHLLSEILVFN